MTSEQAERIAELIVNRLYEVDASRRRILLSPVPEEESRAFIVDVLLRESQATPDRTTGPTAAQIRHVLYACIDAHRAAGADMDARLRAIAEGERAILALFPDQGRLLEGIELAWGVIANAGGGDWTKESPEWQGAAARWRDKYWLASQEEPRRG